MTKAMEKLPSGQNGIGSKNSRNAIYNKMFVAYYQDTGLDVETGKPPKGQNLDWVTAEIKKEQEKKKDIADLVKQTKVEAKSS